MEMVNLRENILVYRNTKDKAVLEDLYIYFTSYIKNISKKIFRNEYKETDLKIKFIKVINKLNLKQDSNDKIQAKIITALKRERASIIKKTIQEQDKHPYYLEDIKVEVKDSEDNYSYVVLQDLLEKLNYQEKTILELSFFKDQTDINIGKIFNITSARVGQIKRLALNKLKQELIN
ncbi:MAG: sigma factor-like helix-turn-helix DNA-binding protein [Sarcina sp.]